MCNDEGQCDCYLVKDAEQCMVDLQALLDLGDEAAAALRVIRENNRNGLPTLSCYTTVYDYAPTLIFHQ